MQVIQSIYNWFTKAKPQATDKDLSTQLGAHVEELHELLEAAGIFEQDAQIGAHIEVLKERPYKGEYQMRVQDLDFLDAICDQIVTAAGLAAYRRYDLVGALKEVDASNYSKFENGVPKLNEHGKIIKGSSYFKPQLKPFMHADGRLTLCQRIKYALGL